MEKFDIEKFPTSRAAVDMLHSISEGFYQNSYVMKWLLQVEGLEWDGAESILRELPLQFFPETATWGMVYHEQKWQLPVKYNLGYDERRKLIYQRRDFKAPMTPYKMELYIGKVLGIGTHIADCHDPGVHGFMPGHPNIFKATFITDGTLDVAAVSEVLDRLKQSHTIYKIEDLIQVVIDSRNLEEFLFRDINQKFAINFWGCDILNGARLLDGSILVDAKKRYNLVLGIKNGIKFNISENMDTDGVCIKILSCFNVCESINGLKMVFMFGCSGFWFPVNGNVPGGYNMPLKIAVPVKARVLNDMDITSLANGIIKACTEEKTGMALDLKASVNFWQGGRQAQGSKGQVLTAQTKHKAVARVSEKIGDVTITYRRNLCYLDGSGLLDGSRLVNAFYGKEDI